MNANVRRHARFDEAVRVLHERLDGEYLLVFAGDGLRCRRDLRNRRFVRFARKRIERQRRLAADSHFGDVDLIEIHLHEEGAQIGNRQKRFAVHRRLNAGDDRFARLNSARNHGARNRRGDSRVAQMVLADVMRDFGGVNRQFFRALVAPGGVGFPGRGDAARDAALRVLARQLRIFERRGRGCDVRLRSFVVTEIVGRVEREEDLARLHGVAFLDVNMRDRAGELGLEIRLQARRDLASLEDLDFERLLLDRDEERRIDRLGRAAASLRDEQARAGDRQEREPPDPAPLLRGPTLHRFEISVNVMETGGMLGILDAARCSSMLMRPSNRRRCSHRQS